MTSQIEHEASNLQGHAPGCPCNNADERGCFLISAETGKCVSCTCDRPADREHGQRNDLRDDGHLPECFMAARLGVDTYAPDVLAQMKRAGCICHRLRSCEARVRSEDDDYAYVAAQAEADGRMRGWSEALDAAIGVVVTWQADRALPPFTALLAALNGLREEP